MSTWYHVEKCILCFLKIVVGIVYEYLLRREEVGGAHSLLFHLILSLLLVIQSPKFDFTIIRIDDCDASHQVDGRCFSHNEADEEGVAFTIGWRRGVKFTIGLVLEGSHTRPTLASDPMI